MGVETVGFVIHDLGLDKMVTFVLVLCAITNRTLQLNFLNELFWRKYFAKLLNAV